MNSFSAISFIAVALSALSHDASSATFCNNPTGKQDSIPTKWPATPYMVSIDAVRASHEKNLILRSNILHTFDPIKNIASTARTQDEGKQSFQYVHDGQNQTFTFVDKIKRLCTAELPFNGSETSPENETFIFSATISYKRPYIYSLNSLWNWATTAGAIYKSDATTHEHGITIDHYFICETVDNITYTEIEICIPVKNETNDQFQLPVRIDIKRYSEVQNGTIDESISYQMFDYRFTLTQCENETAFLPPRGVFCANWAVSPLPFPKIPDSFSTDIVFIDQHQPVKMERSWLYVNWYQHYVAFEYTQTFNEQEMSKTLPAQRWKHRLVHDFNTGIQYMYNTQYGICNKTDAIPTTAADAVLKDGTTPTTTMNDRAYILLGVAPENASVYYVGKRLYTDETLADVWIFNTSKDGNTIYREVFFSEPTWQIGGSKDTPIVLEMNVYSYATSDQVTLTTQRFVNFKEYAATDPVPWKFLDVTPCLKFTSENSFLVAYVNDTLEKVQAAGEFAVENAMKEVLANASGVSPLRIANFYLEYANETLWAFFMLSEITSDKVTPTEYSKPELNGTVARVALNETLLKGSLNIVVPTADSSYYLSFRNGTLLFVPPYFAGGHVVPPPPPPPKQPSGYSGGSMAALGICMLLIGGVLGLVLAFFMWKRNRGIAYQIYE